MPVRHAYLLYVAHDEVKLRYGDVSSHGLSLPPATRIKKAKGASVIALGCIFFV